MSKSIKQVLTLLEKQVLKEDMYEGTEPINELISNLEYSKLEQFPNMINEYVSTVKLSESDKIKLSKYVQGAYTKKLKIVLNQIKSL